MWWPHALLPPHPHPHPHPSLPVTLTCASRYQPSRTLLFAFGQDEEVGGSLGAALIAEKLLARYGAVEVVLDEGTPILLDGIAPFTSRPVALVGVAEKVGGGGKLLQQGPNSCCPPVIL